jgi:predicted component of type VI protein secretion system
MIYDKEDLMAWINKQINFLTDPINNPWPGKKINAESVEYLEQLQDIIRNSPEFKTVIEKDKITPEEIEKKLEKDFGDLMTVDDSSYTIQNGSLAMWINKLITEEKES